MDLVILFDWFTNDSMDAALQATEWQQREMFLRLALMWETAAQQCRNEASTETQANRRSKQGPRVMPRKQAIAIILSEEREAKRKRAR
jgi:hypothetical protein